MVRSFAVIRISGASKELTNPLWSRIHRFLWCTTIRVILNHSSWSRSPQRNTPLDYNKKRRTRAVTTEKFLQSKKKLAPKSANRPGGKKGTVIFFSTYKMKRRQGGGKKSPVRRKVQPHQPLGRVISCISSPEPAILGPKMCACSVQHKQRPWNFDWKRGDERREDCVKIQVHLWKDSKEEPLLPFLKSTFAATKELKQRFSGSGVRKESLFAMTHKMA